MLNQHDFMASLLSPLDNWLNMNEGMVEILLGKDAAKMVGYDQRNPHHCYNLMEHSLRTVQGININKKSVSTSFEFLQTAAFYHDIGKPIAAKEKAGRLVFYNHAKKSAELSRLILSQQGYDETEINLITFFIEHHDDFISYVLPYEDYDKSNPYLVEVTEENIIRHILKYDFIKEKAVWTDLLLLCESDVNAQSDIVFVNGKVVNTKEHKLSIYAEIKKILIKYK